MSPPTEAVEEFKLQTGTLGAEFGGGQTAVANFVVKSGTNEFHGVRRDLPAGLVDGRQALRRQGAEPEPAGAGVAELGRGDRGGRSRCPKVYSGKNRSFFYVTFEKTNAEEQTSTAFRTLPTREFQNGDFSRLSIRPTPVTRGRAPSSAPTRSGGRCGSARSTTPARRASVDGRVVRDPFPNNQIPRALWDAVARNTLEMGLWDAPELDRLLNNQPMLATCCPVFDQKTLAMKFDQVIGHQPQGVVLRESRVADAQQLGRRPLRPAAGPARRTSISSRRRRAGSFRGSENWVVNDRLLHRFAFGYNRFENNNRSVHFNQGWPSTHRPDEPAGHDVPAVRVHGRRGRFSAAWAEELRLELARPQLRGQHDRPGRRDDHQRPAQHQDGLRGALLLRRQRDRRRDGQLQLPVGPDRTCPGSIRPPATPTRASCSAPSRHRAAPCRPSTPTTTSAISRSTCRTTSRSARSSRSTSACAGRSSRRCTRRTAS